MGETQSILVLTLIRLKFDKTEYEIESQTRYEAECLIEPQISNVKVHVTPFSAAMHIMSFGLNLSALVKFNVFPSQTLYLGHFLRFLKVLLVLVQPAIYF